jgi:NAD(P)H dehydrogenase (quinone)
MARIVVVYHSAYGHTRKVAEHIAQGANTVVDTEVTLISVSEFNGDYTVFNEADGIIFGTPTYMGSYSAQFKAFIDGASKVWLNQSWKDKLAAGFTNSGSLGGDKLNTLNSLYLIAMQHSMIWVSTGFSCSGKGPEDINRIGSYAGLMTQADNAPINITPPSGDLKTAELFGARFATIANRWAMSKGL